MGEVSVSASASVSVRMRAHTMCTRYMARCVRAVAQLSPPTQGVWCALACCPPSDQTHCPLGCSSAWSKTGHNNYISAPPPEALTHARKVAAGAPVHAVHRAAWGQMGRAPTAGVKQRMCTAPAGECPLPYQEAGGCRRRL